MVIIGLSGILNSFLEPMNKFYKTITYFYNDIFFSGENLAMQRENEKSAVPVQQHQANKSATWKPRASILQYCLTMISFWFYFLHVWIVKNRVSNTCTSANNNQRRRKVHKSGGANSNRLSLSISEKSWGHGPPSPSGSDAPDNSPLFCTGNPSRICNS